MPPSDTATFASAEGLLGIAREAGRPGGGSDAHQRFIADHWAELAAAAFEGYCRHGAGAVVLWREASGPRRGRHRFGNAPFEPERLWYATQVHTLPGATEAAFDGWEARQIEAYDPHAEAVVLFLEGRALRGYRVAGPPAPPDALRRARVGLN